MTTVNLEFWLNQVPAEIARDKYSLHILILIAGICATIAVISAVIGCIAGFESMQMISCGVFSSLLIISLLLAWDLADTIIQLQTNPQMWALHRLLERLQ